MSNVISITGAPLAHDPALRGYHVAYRPNQVNACPGCGRSHWLVGRLMAECARTYFFDNGFANDVPIGLVGFIFLMLALTYFLNRWLAEWLSALLVGAVLVGIAAILFFNGRDKLSAASLTPDQTIATLKEDQEWAKQQINSVKR